MASEKRPAGQSRTTRSRSDSLTATELKAQLADRLPWYQSPEFCLLRPSQLELQHLDRHPDFVLQSRVRAHTTTATRAPSSTSPSTDPASTKRTRHNDGDGSATVKALTKETVVIDVATIDDDTAVTLSECSLARIRLSTGEILSTYHSYSPATRFTCLCAVTRGQVAVGTTDGATAFFDSSLAVHFEDAEPASRSAVPHGPVVQQAYLSKQSRLATLRGTEVLLRDVSAERLAAKECPVLGVLATGIDAPRIVCWLPGEVEVHLFVASAVTGQLYGLFGSDFLLTHTIGASSSSSPSSSSSSIETRFDGTIISAVHCPSGYLALRFASARGEYIQLHNQHNLTPFGKRIPIFGSSRSLPPACGLFPSSPTQLLALARDVILVIDLPHNDTTSALLPCGRTHQVGLSVLPTPGLLINKKGCVYTGIRATTSCQHIISSANKNSVWIWTLVKSSEISEQKIIKE